MHGTHRREQNSSRWEIMCSVNQLLCSIHLLAFTVMGLRPSEEVHAQTCAYHTHYRDTSSAIVRDARCAESRIQQSTF